MSARRFFVDGSREAGERVAIGERDAHKIARVLRLRDGDELEIVDAAGHTFDARVRSEPQGVHAELIAMRAATSPARLRIDIAQGIPKGAKMDFVIEKATELGAAAVLPFYSRRSVVQDLGDTKLERWRRLAKTAAAQCDRREVPEVRTPSTFEALLDRCAEYDVVLMPWERAAAGPPARVAAGLARERAQRAGDRRARGRIHHGRSGARARGRGTPRLAGRAPAALGNGGIGDACDSGIRVRQIGGDSHGQ